MKMKILIAFRPSGGSFSGGHLKFKQLDTGEWFEEDDPMRPLVRSINQDLMRCIKSINKNSRYTHDIIVGVDHDVEINDIWKKSLPDNVEIRRIDNSCTGVPQERQMFILKNLMLSMADDDIVCYALNADTVLSKNWDVEVRDAYKQYGDDYCYTPMFVEPRTKAGKGNLSQGLIEGPDRDKILEETKLTGELTSQNIWGAWRRDICCHSLTMLIPLDRTYFIESDLDHYAKKAGENSMPNFLLEPCGARGYGYWAPIIARGDKFKQIAPHMPVGFGGDLWIEERVPVKQKVILMKSFVFHLHVDCELDDIEVEHE